MTALIVDDSPRFRELLRTVLNGLVDELQECADGDEAVIIYAARRPDWVLMDARWPAWAASKPPAGSWRATGLHAS